MSRWRPVLILPHFLDRAINSDCDISRTNLDVTTDINQLKDKLQSPQIYFWPQHVSYRLIQGFMCNYLNSYFWPWARMDPICHFLLSNFLAPGWPYNSIHWERRGHIVVSVRPLTLMSPTWWWSCNRHRGSVVMSCDLLLDFVTEWFYLVVVVGCVGNFKCTKAHHRGQRQDTLIQPTRFCPPGVCLFKISSKECYSIQSGLKICVWHKLSCDLIDSTVDTFAANLCRSTSSPSLSNQFG